MTIPKTTTTELDAVKTEIQGFVSQMPMTVTTAAQCDLAKARVIMARRAMKRWASWFDTQILNASKHAYEQAKAAYDQHKGLKADLLQPVMSWIVGTDRNILGWDAKEEARLAALQAKETAKYEAARAKAEAKGKDPETVRPMRVFQPPPKTIKTAEGSYTSVAKKVLVVFDDTLIPETYFTRVRNDRLIEAALRAGQLVPGARLEERRQSAMKV